MNQDFGHPVGPRIVRVTDPPYRAVGDGKTCDRSAFSGGFTPFGYDTVILNRGKIIYKYNDNLFRP